MNINEENLRRTIQEIIMELPEFQELIKKPNQKNVKKDTYNNVVDIKGFLEKDEIDTEKLLAQIEKTVNSLNSFKKTINNNLKS